MDEPQALTVSLTPQDWQIVLMGMHKLTIEVGAPTLNRLMTALADAQKPVETPHLREVNDG